jgi:hypothetical protein
MSQAPFEPKRPDEDIHDFFKRKAAWLTNDADEKGLIPKRDWTPLVIIGVAFSVGFIVAIFIIGIVCAVKMIFA